MQGQERFGPEKKRLPAAVAAVADGHGSPSAAAAACFEDTPPRMGQEGPHSTGLMCVPQKSYRAPVGQETLQADQSETEGYSSQTLE